MLPALRTEAIQQFIDRPHVVQAHLVGEQDKAWSIICKCGAAMQRNARKTARTMTPSSSHLLAPVCTAELVTCLRLGDGRNRKIGQASVREGVWQYVWFSVVPVSF